VTSESDKFLRKLEIENNGPILWKTYAFLLAREGRGTESLGGLLYIVGGSRGNTAENRLIFEDFESERPYFLVLGARRKAYKKTKLQKKKRAPRFPGQYPCKNLPVHHR
jgi:hypothetical protein